MSLHPKQKPIRLKGAAKTAFRKEVYLHYGGICCKCGLPAPLYDSNGQFNLYTCGHVAHIKSYGAGGGDTLDNVKWKHYYCHIELEHGPQWSNKL